MAKTVNNPALFVRTIIKEVPTIVTESKDFLTYTYDENDKAFYLQPTVPLIVDLEVIEPNEYDRIWEDNYNYLLNAKGGEKKIRETSFNIVASNVNLALEAYYDNERDARNTDVVFMDHCSDIQVEKVWKELEFSKVINLHNEEAKARNIPQAKRRYLTSLILDSRNKEIKEEFIRAWGRVSYREEMSKILEKANVEMRTKYIALNDPRLKNKEFKYVYNEENNEYVIKGHHVTTEKIMVDTLTKCLEVNQKILDKIDDRVDVYHKGNDEDYEYAPEYVDLALEKVRLSNPMYYDEDEFNLLNDKIEGVKSRQTAFMKPNQFSLSNISFSNTFVETIEPSVFKDEYEFAQFKAMMAAEAKGIPDISEVMQNLPQYIVQDEYHHGELMARSPFFVYVDNGGKMPEYIIREPKPVFDVDFRMFYRKKVPLWARIKYNKKSK